MDTPNTADIVIVGGGVMGASAAYHLAKRGMKNILLLEKEEFFGTGATGRCAGGVRYQFSTEINVSLSLASLPMIERFKEGNFAGVITVTGSEDVSKGGLNFFDDEFCLTRLVEKPTAAELAHMQKEGLLRAGQTVWYNAGIYIFRPVIFEFTEKLEKSPRGEYELTDAVNRMAAAGHKIAGMQIAGRWVDVRDPEVLAALEEHSG